MAREREKERKRTSSNRVNSIWYGDGNAHCFVGFVRNKYASSPAAGPGRKGNRRGIDSNWHKTVGWLPTESVVVAIFERRTFRYKLDRKWLFTSSGPLVNVHASSLSRSSSAIQLLAPLHFVPVHRPHPPSPHPQRLARSHPYLLVARAVAVKRPPVSPDNVYWKIYSNIFN